MHFLPDVWVECDTCRGQRYNPDVLEVRFHGKNIADVLDMSCGQAVELFANIPKIRRILQTLCDVGLDYLTLGQSAPTLSGGEAQRVKLAAELARPDTGQTLYLLDEPTTGLHFDDLAKLLEVLNRLVDQGNTVVVIEHNLDVIKTADWVIDLGPEAGADGGYVVACGTPEQIVEVRSGEGGRRKEEKKSKRSNSALPTPHSALVSHTAVALAPVLAAGPFVERKPYDPAAAACRRPDDLDIDEVGRDTRMPWEVDGRGWHTQDRVARDGRAVQVGRPHSRCDRAAHSRAGRVRRDELEQPLDRRDHGGEEIGRLVLPRDHRRALAGEAEVPHGEENVRARQAGGRPGPQAAERHRRDRSLWPRAAGEVQEPARAVAGSADRRPFVAGNRHAGVLVVSWSGRWPASRNSPSASSTKPEDVMPWKVLGQKWHLSQKGFPPGKKTAWKPEVLEELLEMLADAVPGGQFLWNNQNVVYLMVPGVRKPWATVFTKRLAGVDLVLNGPKGAFQLGSVAELGSTRALATDADDRDQVKLRFVTTDELHSGNVAAFLRVHLESLRGGGMWRN